MQKRTKKTNNPQLEKGFIRIATGKKDNDLIRALLGQKLNGAEWDVIMIVLRKTWGFQKMWDNISFSQFETEGQRNRRNYMIAIKGLIEKRILLVSNPTLYKVSNSTLVEKPKFSPNKYRFNKQYSAWTSVANAPSVENCKKVVSKSTHTKRNLYKKNQCEREENPQVFVKLQKFLVQFIPLREAIKQANELIEQHGSHIVAKALTEEQPEDILGLIKKLKQLRIEEIRAEGEFDGQDEHGADTLQNSHENA